MLWSDSQLWKPLNFSAQQKASSHHSAWKTNKNFRQVSWRWLDWQDRSGKVAIICSSFDSALLTWDLLQQNQIVTACSAIMENSLSSETEDIRAYCQQLPNILQELASLTEIEVILLNIWDSDAVCKEIVETIRKCSAEMAALATPAQQVLVNSASQKNSSRRSSGGNAVALAEGNEAEAESVSANLTLANSVTPRFVLRLLSPPKIDDITHSEQIYLFSSLEASIDRTIALIKSS